MSDIFKERIIKIEKQRIGDALPNMKNPKIHGPLQAAQLRGVVGKYGKLGVLLTYTDHNGDIRLFDGHGRQELNPEEVWWVAHTDLTQQEVDSLVLMYDPIASSVEWDREVAAALMNGVDETNAALMNLLGRVAEEAHILEELGDGRSPSPGDRSDAVDRQGSGEDPYDGAGGVVCPKCGYAL